MMMKRIPQGSMLMMFLALCTPLVSALEKGGGWTELFNGKDLTGWKASLGRDGDEASLPLERIFTVRGGAIRVYDGADAGSGQASANLRHESEWSDFHLQVEYRWLGKKFAPRNDADRDAGILFHIHTEPGKVWPPSLEMQMGDGQPGDDYVTGDLFVIGNTRADCPSPGAKYTPGAGMTTRGPGAAGTRVAATENPEKPPGEWKPLGKGGISVQAEWAELEYRAIRIRRIE